MLIKIPEKIYGRLDCYSDYIIQNGMVSEERAVNKVRYIIASIRTALSNPQFDGRLCPYWAFGGSGCGYRMIQVKDRWSDSTKWDIAYFTSDDGQERTIKGIELDSVLASKDKIVYPPYQMRLQLEERKIHSVVNEVLRRFLQRT